ncbi:glycosyltransferase family 92 protein [Scenedesmus sp. PABB004]|nr:glycosyltransferase family 92 protein [Scenedesmus sp. PABB004]
MRPRRRAAAAAAAALLVAAAAAALAPLRAGAAPAHGAAAAGGGVAGALHAFLPAHLVEQQAAMLAALQRHHHQDLHALISAKAAANGSAGAGPGGPAGPGAGAAPTESDLLHALATKWPQGYVAVCAVVKDQGRDLRYWIEYHRWLGVSKFYIYDNNSTSPALLGLWDLIEEGVVDYHYFRGRPRRRPDFHDTNQYAAYTGCLLSHFRLHRWIAFIDVDEFLVFPPPGAEEGGQPGGGEGDARWQPGEQPAAGQGGGAGEQQQQGGQARQQQPWDAPRADGGGADGAPGGEGLARGRRSRASLGAFLSRYEYYAALGVNWVLFGSGGLAERPPGGPLASYTACVPRGHWESTHVKMIANTGAVLGLGGTPHEVLPRRGRVVVDVDGVPFTGPKTPTAKWHKLVLHHYVLKSRAEFGAKRTRGSGAGNVKDWAFFDYMDALANATCGWGPRLSAAFLSSGPRLRPPRGGAGPCGRARGGGGGGGGTGGGEDARGAALPADAGERALEGGAGGGGEPDAAGAAQQPGGGGGVGGGGEAGAV